MSKKCLHGKGTLVFNSNAIDRREYSKVRIDNKGVLKINGNVQFYCYCNVHIGSNAIMELGDGTYINENALISVKKSIKIGSNCAISNNVSIMDSDFHYVVGNDVKEKGVIIGNHVWIGHDVSILKNVTIGNNVIIGAATVVTKDVPDNCIVVGNPAKIIRENMNWE